MAQVRSLNRFNKLHRNKLSIARSSGYLDVIVGDHKLCAKCGLSLPLNNFDRNNRRSNGYQIWCKECDKKQKKLTYHEYRRDAVRAQTRKSQLKCLYGMTPEDYDALLSKQNGLCAICERTPQKGGNQFVKKYLVIDHCHATDRVRGLLCSECNLGLSKFEDSPTFLRNAVDYLLLYEVKK